MNFQVLFTNAVFACALIISIKLIYTKVRIVIENAKYSNRLFNQPDRLVVIRSGADRRIIRVINYEENRQQNRISTRSIENSEDIRISTLFIENSEENRASPESTENSEEGRASTESTESSEEYRISTESTKNTSKDKIYKNHFRKIFVKEFNHIFRIRESECEFTCKILSYQDLYYLQLVYRALKRSEAERMDFCNLYSKLRDSLEEVNSIFHDIFKNKRWHSNLTPSQRKNIVDRRTALLAVNKIAENYVCFISNKDSKYTVEQHKKFLLFMANRFGQDPYFNYLDRSATRGLKICHNSLKFFAAYILRVFAGIEVKQFERKILPFLKPLLTMLLVEKNALTSFNLANLKYNEYMEVLVEFLTTSKMKPKIFLPTINYFLTHSYPLFTHIRAIDVSLLNNADALELLESLKFIDSVIALTLNRNNDKEKLTDDFLPLFEYYSDIVYLSLNNCLTKENAVKFFSKIPTSLVTLKIQNIAGKLENNSYVDLAKRLQNLKHIDLKYNDIDCYAFGLLMPKLSTILISYIDKKNRKQHVLTKFKDVDRKARTAYHVSEDSKENPLREYASDSDCN